MKRRNISLDAGMRAKENPKRNKLQWANIKTEEGNREWKKDDDEEEDKKNERFQNKTNIVVS